MGTNKCITIPPAAVEKMNTIQEDEELKLKEQHKLEDRLKNCLKNLQINSTTESIGHRNVSHRRVQSSDLFSALDTPVIGHRPRSLSIVDHPSLFKYYPGSHLLERIQDTGCLYLSLWLLPPLSIRKQLSKDITKLSMTYTREGSSAPFVPHITIIGSIRCETQREATELGKKLLHGLQGSGKVPCRFLPKPCVAMFNGDKIVWSQACIAIMERCKEYMNILALSRKLLGLPPGEWMFPGPACEPHFSKFYGAQPIPQEIEAPPDFVADQASLVMTTPGTLQGVAKWREITVIDL